MNKKEGVQPTTAGLPPPQSRPPPPRRSPPPTPSSTGGGVTIPAVSSIDEQQLQLQQQQQSNLTDDDDISIKIMPNIGPSPPSKTELFEFEGGPQLPTNICKKEQLDLSGKINRPLQHLDFQHCINDQNEPEITYYSKDDVKGLKLLLDAIDDNKKCSEDNNDMKDNKIDYKLDKKIKRRNYYVRKRCELLGIDEENFKGVKRLVLQPYKKVNGKQTKEERLKKKCIYNRKYYEKNKEKKEETDEEIMAKEQKAKKKREYMRRYYERKKKAKK